jgi:hypothetical protein
MVAEFRIRKEIKQREAARAVILCHLHYFSIVSVCACFAEPHQHVSFSAAARPVHAKAPWRRASPSLFGLANLRLHPPPSASIRLHPPPSAVARPVAPCFAKPLRQASCPPPSAVDRSVAPRRVAAARGAGAERHAAALAVAAAAMAATAAAAAAEVADARFKFLQFNEEDSIGILKRQRIGAGSSSSRLTRIHVCSSASRLCHIRDLPPDRRRCYRLSSSGQFLFPLHLVYQTTPTVPQPASVGQGLPPTHDAARPDSVRAGGLPGQPTAPPPPSSTRKLLR